MFIIKLSYYFKLFATTFSNALAKIKLIVLQMCSLIGLLLGVLLAPNLYPYVILCMPGPDEMALIHTSLIAWIIIVVAYSVFFTSIARLYLKTSYQSLEVVTLISGFLIWVVSLLINGRFVVPPLYVWVPYILSLLIFVRIAILLHFAYLKTREGDALEKFFVEKSKEELTRF